MRIPQKVGTDGSLKWLQRTIGTHSLLLTDAIRAASGRTPDWTIEWRSPREIDDWAEYRDGMFLDLLDLQKHRDALSVYWPSGGPQWDALGVGKPSGVILVEAKAHVSELRSRCGAGPDSLATIQKSLNASKTYFGAEASVDWLAPYYQYANRLAHLRFLRTHGIEATMAFVYFVGDNEMGGPASEEDWRSALSPVYRHLGVERDLSNHGVCNIFIDTAVLG